MIDIIKIAEKLVETPADIQVELDNSKCLKQFKFSKCSTCHQVCPEKAIKIENNKILFSKDKCTSCGLCLSVCPNEAFYSKPSFFNLVLDKLDSDKITSFSCQKSKQKESNKFNCLASLNEAILVQTALKTHGLILITDSCNKCNYKNKALPLINEKVTLANNFLEIIGSRKEITISEKLDMQKNKLSRRQFMATVSKNLAHVGASAFSSNKDKNNTISKSRLILKSIVEKDKIQTKKQTELPFFQVTLNKDCDLCLKCSELCPTGALFSQVKKEHLRLRFQTLKCSGCKLCLDACPRASLNIASLTNTALLKRNLILKKSKVSRCSSCGRLLTDKEQNTCLSCQKKKTFNSNIESLFA
ncbi:MAG: 4Fe-4S dicluster domain-containing protein [Actinobacteria bacterium]|nr:MAG: 4Fe-4S dicluster domain-containing protein [Actinomycetota bacterium]